MTESYATPADYTAMFPEGDGASEEELQAATQHIDSLTFGRIRGAGGLAALSEYQRAAVREAVCRQTRFEKENASAVAFSVAAYSINGVSMKAGYGEGVRYYGGIAVPGEVSSLLDQTGLCCRLAGAAP